MKDERTFTEDERTFTVQIATSHDGDLKRRGSGAVVGDRLVLTSRHVVCSVEKDRLRVRLGPSGEPFAVVDVLADDAHDIALVRVDRDFGVPVARVALQSVAVNQEINAIGYPKLHLDVDAPSEAPWTVGGWTRDTIDGKLHIDVTGAPERWAGFSGAAIRVDGQVVAVVRSYSESWVANNRLLAVPLFAVAQEAWFAEAVFGDAAAQHRALRDLAWGRLTDVVDGSEAVKNAVETALGVRGGVIDALRRATCQDALDALDTADEILSRAGVGARDRDRSELWHATEALLPHLVDWEATMLAARASAQLGQRALQFHLCRETLAEVMLAGIDGQPCRFRKLGRDDRLAGVGFVAVPGVLRSPLRLTGPLTKEAVAEALRDKVITPSEQELLRDLGGLTGEKEPRPTARWARAINVQLRRQAEGKGHYFERSLRRSLVVLDEDLGEHADLVWNALVDHVSRSLPELRLVRMTTPADLVDDHTDLSAPIEGMHKRRQQAEGDHDDHHD